MTQNTHSPLSEDKIGYRILNDKEKEAFWNVIISSVALGLRYCSRAFSSCSEQ